MRRGQESGGDRQGHPADRGRPSRGEEPGDDRPVGSVPEAHRARAGASLRPFLKGIEEYVRDVVGKAARWTAQSRRTLYRPRPRTAAAAASRTATIAERDLEPQNDRPARLHEVLKKCFGFDSFRPNQEEVCRVVTRAETCSS